ncbi:MAG: hypothetical protein JNK31_04650 [Candidatus Competibacter sp.]|nr:hypothetical protein [Candidatus Competibacter sp.]
MAETLLNDLSGHLDCATRFGRAAGSIQILPGWQQNGPRLTARQNSFANQMPSQPLVGFI